jgi:hypothetical protein
MPTALVSDVTHGPGLLDSETLAGPEWLNLPSPRTLDNWAWRGVGPRYIKVGRHRRYDPAEVQRWLDGQTIGGEPDGNAAA